MILTYIADHLLMKKMKVYSADFKAKAVIELLNGDLTLNEIASKHGITPKSLQNWKQQFLANASLAFNTDAVAKEYKDKLSEKDKEINELHRQLGKRTAELEWTSKKLKSLDYKTQKALVDSKLKAIPVTRQCELIGYSRSNVYYKPLENAYNKNTLLRAIDNIYTEIPFYGYRKVHQQLLKEGVEVGIN